MSEYFSLTILEQKYSHKRVYAAGYIFVRAHTQAGQWRGSTKSFLISTFIAERPNYTMPFYYVKVPK